METIRNGRGYWIDEETRIATREVEWKDGVEVSGRDLYDGWYTQSAKPKPNPNPFVVPIMMPKPAVRPVPDPFASRIIVTESTKWSDVSLQVTDLTISSNCCNDLNALDLNQYKRLESIEIGNECFESVKTFKIDGLNRLTTLKIGKNSFTQQANSIVHNLSKSFHILNCESLKTVEIGEFSFSDFAGGFELKNLPQLRSIQIGIVRSVSRNFVWSSFVIRSIEMILNI